MVPVVLFIIGFISMIRGFFVTDILFTSSFRIVESRPGVYKAQRRNIFFKWKDWNRVEYSGPHTWFSKNIEEVQEYVSWWMRKLKKEEKEKRFKQRTIKEWN